MVGGGLDVGVVGFALVVAAEDDEASMVDEHALRVADGGEVQVGTRLVVIQGTEGVAHPAGIKSTFGKEETCPCSVGCWFCYKSYCKCMKYFKYEKLYLNRSSASTPRPSVGRGARREADVH